MQNKIALVIGGTTGIGEACVKKLAAHQAEVIFCGRNNTKGAALENLLRNQGYIVDFYQIDVAKEKEILQFFKYIQSKFGRLDIAINNAGITGPKTKRLHEFNTNEWHNIMDINLFSCFLCMKHELNLMLKNNSPDKAIVNISSIAGIKAGKISALYTASKHAMIGLTRAAAREYAPRGIRINAVCPAFIDTNMIDNNLLDSIGAINKHIPLGRLGTPEEVANAIIWLCTLDASFITGTSLLVDGGINA